MIASFFIILANHVDPEAHHYETIDEPTPAPNLPLEMEHLIFHQYNILEKFTKLSFYFCEVFWRDALKRDFPAYVNRHLGSTFLNDDDEIAMDQSFEPRRSSRAIYKYICTALQITDSTFKMEFERVLKKLKPN